LQREAKAGANYQSVGGKSAVFVQFNRRRGGGNLLEAASKHARLALLLDVPAVSNFFPVLSPDM
jgi:hypothetical protein